MAGELQGCRVAVLATDGVEQVELTRPVEALRAAGAAVTVVAPKAGAIRGWNHHDKADAIPVDLPLAQADAGQFHALLLPGGVVNPDQLRMDPAAVRFVHRFVDAEKPIAAICHGPWTLIEAGGVNDRRLTSWPSLRTDLVNAGAHWVDEAVVTDRGLVTSRRPDDLPAFIRGMIAAFREGTRAG